MSTTHCDEEGRGHEAMLRMLQAWWCPPNHHIKNVHQLAMSKCLVSPSMSFHLHLCPSKDIDAILIVSFTGNVTTVATSG